MTLKILTWHIHGSYLYYLSHIRHTLYVPVKAGRPDRYCGRTPSYPWPSNLVEVPAEEVRNLDLDCVIFQAPENYESDQFEILSATQQKLPKIYLEHNPPQNHPVDESHWVDDPNTLLVHVTPFNELFWNNNRTPTKVIEHGIKTPEGIRYSGDTAKGLVVINNLLPRGRRLGLDIFETIRSVIPLDLVGMGWQELGGHGEIAHSDLFAFAARYRFLFNPIRWTSLGLSVLEAMSVGVPVVGLATTEMVRTIENGHNGFLSTRVEELIDFMEFLLNEPQAATYLGEGARRTVLERFSIERFVSDWESTVAEVCRTAIYASLSSLRGQLEDYE